MVHLNVGLNGLKTIHAAAIDKGQMGTDGTAPDPTQTGLQAAVAASKLDVSIDSSGDKTNVINYTLPSTTATGNTFREFIYMDDGTYNFARVVFTGLAHTSNEDIIIRYSVFYRNP